MTAAPGDGVAEALRDAAGGPHSCVVVADREDPAVELVLREVPERLVPVAGAAARVGVAAGIALTGRRVAVVAEGAPSGLPAVAGLVAVMSGARAAGACWGAGWTLVQPGSARDVAPLLASSLGAGEPVVLRVGRRSWAPGMAAPEAGAPAPADPPRLGVARVLREGTAGLLAASGPDEVRLLATVARMLAGRGVALQAVEIHTSAAGEGPGPQATDGTLFLGQAACDAGSLDGGRWPPGLLGVAVPHDARAAMEAVASHVLVRR